MVSGGADSTCLMHLLAEVHDGPVGVLSVDHGLREASAEEAAAVAAAAEGLGLRAHVAAPGLAPGPAVQERAREARLAAARATAAEWGYERIATGHTASDQAETVLFRMARGTGRTGALGMAPRAGDLVRPLLAVSGEETRAWCAERGLDVVRDPSNEDPAYARARVRGGLLPALREVHPAAERHVAALAATLRDEAELLEPLVDAAWARAAAPAGDGLAVAALRTERPAMRRLLARRLIAAAGLGGDALGAAAVERVLALAAGGGAAAGLPGGGRALVERGALVVSGPPGPAPAPARLGVPGVARFGGATLRARPGEGLPPSPERVAVRPELAGGAGAEHLRVRAPRDGDRLPLPGGGHQAVGRLLAARGVPARLRAGVPVVASGDRVVWVAGHRAADDLVVRAGPALVLEMERA